MGRWKMLCDFEGCGETTSTRGFDTEEFEEKARRAAVGKGWSLLSDGAEHYCPQHAPRDVADEI